MNDIYSILPGYYKQRIAVVGKLNYFIDYRDALVECIRHYGFEAFACSEIDEALAMNPTCITVIGSIVFDVFEHKNDDIIWILIQTEQLYLDDIPSKQAFLNKMRKKVEPILNCFDIILEWDKCNIKWLKERTKAIVEHFPYAWFPALEYEGDHSINEDEKYDILFIGELPGIDKRRKVLLDYLSKKYKVYPKTRGVWGEEKKQAIASSKICLNIHYDESRYAETDRLFDYFSKKRFVLSEPIRYPEPFVEGEDYVEFFWTNLCEKIDYYLSNNEERQRIAQNAYNKLHQYTLLESTKILIDTLLLVSYNKMREREEKKKQEELEAIKAANKFYPRLKRLIKRILRKIRKTAED